MSKQKTPPKTAAAASKVCAPQIGPAPDTLDEDLESLLTPPTDKLPTEPNGTSYRFKVDIAREVLWRVSQGETVANICKDKHMPTPLCIWYWERHVSSFAKAMEIARARQGEAWGEMAVQQSLEDPYEGLDKTDRDSHSVAKVRTMHQRVKGDILLRAAGRRDPERWGERPQPGSATQIIINTNLGIDKPIQADRLVATATDEGSER